MSYVASGYGFSMSTEERDGDTWYNLICPCSPIAGFERHNIFPDKGVRAIVSATDPFIACCAAPAVHPFVDVAALNLFSKNKLEPLFPELIVADADG